MIAAEIAEAIGEPSLAKRHLLTAFQAWSAADAAPPGDVPALLALRVADLLRLEPQNPQGRAAHAQLLAAVGRLLEMALRTRVSAFLAGLGATAVLQSSTATGLMVAGLASIGLVGLVPALAVLLGAGVGTTLIVQVLSFPVAGFA